MEQELLSYIKNAQRILVTSHVSPDPDAICSSLLLANTIKANFKDKSVFISLENEPDALSFLHGYDRIEFKSLADSIKKNSPQLLIAVDSPNIKRCTRGGIDAVMQNLTALGTKTVGIDHHQPDNSDVFDLYLNKTGPAAVQEIYEVCFDELKLIKPSGYAETTMFGLYSDTGGFVYKNTRPRRTFKLVADLIDEGVNLESIHNKLHSYTSDHLKVLGELATNVSGGKDYTYTYVSDDFYKQWQNDGKSPTVLRTACKMFVDDYIRNIDGRLWGFIVYQNPLLGEDGYSVSLRSVGGIVDVSAVAKKLGGGGHKPAAAAEVHVKSIQEAVAKVESAIAS
ncbi:DHH family phosphoesterase [Candidatus Saccharibacteria bacterium]|nr:DHH family phosphoesterase [Candidatus Saccharibacteria bacterium]